MHGHPRTSFLNDAWEVFVKFSYLFHFSSSRLDRIVTVRTKWGELAARNQTVLPAGRRQGSLVNRRTAPLKLTAQQTSLVKAVTLGRADYLNRSYFLDPVTGKRTTTSVKGRELSSFTASWAVAPIECIRTMNEAIGRLDDPSRRSRYLKAAVELEIVMDGEITRSDTKVQHGVPSYLANGYTDMGSRSSLTERRGREKIRVDKEGLLDQLVDSKRQALEAGATPGLLATYCDSVRRDLVFDELGVTSSM